MYLNKMSFPYHCVKSLKSGFYHWCFFRRTRFQISSKVLGMCTFFHDFLTWNFSKNYLKISIISLWEVFSVTFQKKRYEIWVDSTDGFIVSFEIELKTFELFPQLNILQATISSLLIVILIGLVNGKKLIDTLVQDVVISFF